MTVSSTSSNGVAPFQLQLQDFEQGLRNWANDPASTGNTQEAVNRILAAKRNNSSELGMICLRLTTLPPEIGTLSSLTKLYVRVNQLQELPTQIGNLSSLTELIVCGNQLQQLPTQIGNLRLLTELNVSENQLRQLPTQIGNLCSLTELNVYDNQLQQLPTEIGNLSSLTKLLISENQLQQLPPQIRNLSSLSELYVSDNQLRQLPPEIGNLSSLTRLYVRDNQLQQLPIALGNISGLTFISMNGNSVPDEQRDAILAACRAKRDRGALDVLPSRLELWKSVAGLPDVELGFILEMVEEERFTIAEWLLRLSRSAEYGRAQKELAEKAVRMLASLEDNGDFRAAFFDQAEANNAACGDRAAMAFNELYVSWKIHTLDNSAPLKDKLRLLAGCAKTLTLRNELLSQLEGKDEHESVEIFLYYECHLKNPLELITAVDHMTYESIGKRDWINVDSLKAAVNANFLKTLLDFPEFTNLARQDTALQEKLAQINDDFQERLANLSSGTLSHDQIAAQSKALQAEKEQAEHALYLTWFNQNS